MAAMVATAVVPAIPALAHTARNIFFTIVKFIFFILMVVGLIVFFSGKFVGGFITMLFAGLVIYAIGAYFPYQYSGGYYEGGLDVKSLLGSIGSVIETVGNVMKSAVGANNHSGGLDEYGYFRNIDGGLEDNCENLKIYRDFRRLCQLEDISGESVNEFVQFIMDNKIKIKRNYDQMSSTAKQQFMEYFNKLTDPKLNELREEFISL